MFPGGSGFLLLALEDTPAAGPAAQVKLISCRIGGRRLCDGRFLRVRQHHLEMRCHRAGDLAWRVEHVAQWHRELRAPSLPLVAQVHQTHIDLDLLIFPSHVAFEQVTHAEFPSDFRQVAPAERIIARARGTKHVERGEMREMAGDFILHAGDEQRIGLILAEVVEWQHCQGRLFYRYVRRIARPLPSPSYCTRANGEQ